MGRAPCCDKANVKRGPWSTEEDATLKDYIDKNGTGGNWIALPQKIGLKRCGKSCRLRWLNYLRPNIKHGGFTEDEDKIICSLYISIGSRWSVIAAQLPGRTDNDIKNYWNTRLKKKLLGKRKQTIMDRLSSLPHLQDNNQKNGNKLVEDNPYLQNLSNSAIERLELHMHLQTTFSFYNNPTLWPTNSLNPPNEKITQNIQSFNNGEQIMYESFSPQRIIKNNMEAQEFEDNVNGYSTTIAQKTSTTQEQDVNTNRMMISSYTQGEIDELLINKNVGFLPPSSSQSMAEVDRFKEIDGPAGLASKDQLLWWLNDFDTNSASSSSWDDSTSLVYPSGELCQDFVVGYNNHPNQLQ